MRAFAFRLFQPERRSGGGPPLTPMGSTGRWPLPSGDSPLGTGEACELARAFFSSANILPIPSTQWPDGTGGSPVLPMAASVFGFNSPAISFLNGLR